jgi:hypothetical protein
MPKVAERTSFSSSQNEEEDIVLIGFKSTRFSHPVRRIAIRID